MKDKKTPPPQGEPIVLRLNLHIHDLSGKFKKKTAPGSSRNSLPTNPRQRPAAPPLADIPPEGAIDRNRLRDLVDTAVPAETATSTEPDIEVTLVLYV